MIVVIAPPDVLVPLGGTDGAQMIRTTYDTAFDEKRYVPIDSGHRNWSPLFVDLRGELFGGPMVLHIAGCFQ